MKTLGNIIWFIFGGLFWAISAFLGGVVCCITIIGIPVGLQLFKMAGFVLWPFGKKVKEQKVTGLKNVLKLKKMKICLIYTMEYGSLGVNMNGLQAK